MTEQLPVRPAAKTSGLAIASLACSAVGLSVYGGVIGSIAGVYAAVAAVVGSIAGVVLGIVALVGIKRTGQSGRGFAIAGIIVGALGLLGWLIVVLLILAVGMAIK